MSSYTGMGCWFILRLMAEGHDVDYYLSKPEYEDVLSGLIPKPKALSLDHRRTVQGYGYPSYKGYDLSLFDLTGRARQSDASRVEAPTIGDGSFEHTLEDDREAGIQTMESCGIKVPPYEKFEDTEKAKAFIAKEDKRYVYKPYEGPGGSDDKGLTYVSKNAEDMLGMIDRLFKLSKGMPFILQEFVEGTEASVAGFFNGKDFYQLTCTLEEKKFMNDNKGPNTGCSGNLVFAISENSKLYKEGLAKCIPVLQSVNFTGMIDLNTILTTGTAFGLEWTPRFGYLADATIAAMYGYGYGEMLRRIATGEVPEQKWEAPFGMSVLLSIPPYPTEIRVPKAKDISIEGINPNDVEQLCNIYMYDVMLAKNKKSLTTSGNYGFVCAPTGVGDSIQAASEKCDKLTKQIQIPNMQYRTDITKSTMKRYNFLEDNGWI